MAETNGHAIGRLWEPQGVEHGSNGRWDPAKLGKFIVDKESKRGGGGQPQNYDSRGRYTSGGSFAGDTMVHAGGRPVVTKLPKKWPQDSDGTFEPIGWAAEGARLWRARNGLPEADISALRSHRIDPKLSKALADSYVRLLPDKVGSAERKAWTALGHEVDRQYEFMTKEMGVKVTFVKDEWQGILHDVFGQMRKDKHFHVLDTAVQSEALGVKQYHPVFTDLQNNKFRAVHDVFGHAAIGRGFDYDGEDSAWAHHGTMIKQGSPAWKALATETTGQNSYHSIYRDFDPYQRVGFLPDALIRRRVVKSVVFGDPKVRERAELRVRYFAPVTELAKYNQAQARDENGRWVTLHRGESSGNKGGTFWSEDREFARNFTESGRDREIKTMRMAAKDIYNPPKPVFAGDVEGVDTALAHAKTKGYKGVRFDEGEGQPASVWVLKYDPQQQRDQRGRWSATGGHAASIATSRIETTGGFTVHPTTGDEPTEGFAVSKWPDRSLVFGIAGMAPARVARNIRTWLRSNRDMLDDPMVHIGGWHDRESNDVYVDFSVVHPRGSREAAIRDAVENNQKAIYSLHDQEEIPTGGTGEAMGKAADDSMKPVDRFFIPVAGKSIDELTDQVMEALGIEEDVSDDEE